jgi:glycosyltransferase involved in cell wall biosynthesis
MNIVSVVPYRIVPPVDGGKTLSFNANRAIAQAAATFRCIALPVLREPPLKADSPFPYTELRTVASLLIGLERSGLFPKMPYFRALDLYSQRMAEECMVEPCDVVEVSFPWLMGIRKYLPPSIKVVLLMQNVETVYHADSIDSRLFSRFFANMLERIERDAIELADHVVVLTERDRGELIGRYGVRPERLSVVPPGCHLPMTRPESSSRSSSARRVVFTGTAFPSNVEAARVLIRQVAPSCLGFTEFTIAGNVCSRLRRLPLPANVTLAGYVDDLGQLYSQMDAFISCINMKTGISMKVIEALGFGLKVVATPGAVVGYESLFNGPVCVGSVEEIPGLVRNVKNLSVADIQKLKPFEWCSVAARRLEAYGRAVSESGSAGRYS